MNKTMFGFLTVFLALGLILAGCSNSYTPSTIPSNGGDTVSATESASDVIPSGENDVTGEQDGDGNNDGEAEEPGEDNDGDETGDDTPPPPPPPPTITTEEDWEEFLGDNEVDPDANYKETKINTGGLDNLRKVLSLKDGGGHEEFAEYGVIVDWTNAFGCIVYIHESFFAEYGSITVKTMIPGSKDTYYVLTPESMTSTADGWYVFAVDRRNWGNNGNIKVQFVDF